MNDILGSIVSEPFQSTERSSTRLRLPIFILVIIAGIWCIQVYTGWHAGFIDVGPAVQINRAPVATTKSAISMLHAVINGSLYRTVAKAGLGLSLAIQLRDIFSSKIDFRRDTRTGDWFSVIYASGVATSAAEAHKIIAAEISIRNHIYHAFLFSDGKAHVEYYTSKGENLQQSILRAPLNYNHISSPFSYHRLDPVTHVIRPHFGVDYAAPVGTPVEAAADGYIRFLGDSAGYGNLIVISSFGKYETYYAHLKRFAHGLHTGSHVQQGHVIGYVGESGEATGPHLHFGIMVSGVWRNPLTVALPDATPLPRSELSMFQRQIAPLLIELNGMNTPLVSAAASASADIRGHINGPVTAGDSVKVRE